MKNKFVDYDKYQKDLSKRSLRLYTFSAVNNPQKSSGRPRSYQEESILFLLDQSRWEKAMATGILEKTGPRRYKWNG